MLWIEATTSQEYVRQYFTDIGQPAKKGYFAAPTGTTTFYAINTSLSAFFLASAGVLLIFASTVKQSSQFRETCLFGGQGVIFLWMAIDERFMLHETIGAALHTRSSVILAAAAIANVTLYLAVFRPHYFNLRMAGLFTLAVLIFLIMMIFDVFLPHEMPMRLSLEDLSKTWSGFTFLLFGWEAARFRLVGKPGGEKSLQVPSYIEPLFPRWWSSRPGA